MKLEKTQYDHIYKYKIKSGTRYRVRYSYTVNYKREIFDKSGIESIREAKYILKDFQDLIGRASNGEIKNLKTTVEDYWQIFYEKKVKTKQWTVDSERYYTHTVDNYILPRWRSYLLREIERNEYELWIAKLLTKFRRETVKGIHRAYMAMLNDAVYNSTLSKNPCLHINIGPSTLPPISKEVSVHNFKIWMNKAEEILSPLDFSMVYLATFGMRMGEILGIKPKCLTQLDNGLVEVHIEDSRSEHSKLGKGRVKTKSSDRYIILNKKASDLLFQSLADTRKFCLTHYSTILNDDDFLWLDRRSKVKRWINPGKFGSMFRKVSKETGIRISCHMLRHFFVTQSIAAGVSMEDTARFVGHTQKYMTEAYTHIKNETAQKVVNGFSDYLGLE